MTDLLSSSLPTRHNVQVLARIEGEMEKRILEFYSL